MEMLDLLILGAAALVGGYAFVFGFLRKLNDWYYVGRLRHLQNPLPPGDMGWPLLGYMPAFLKAYRSDPNSFINDLVARYGRTGIFRTHLFGCPSVIVCGPDTCRKVFTDDAHFQLGYPTSATTLGGKRALHNVSYAEHKRLRRLITSPIIGHEALSSYVDFIQNIAIETLDELSSKKKPFELLMEMRTFAFKVITKIFMGDDVDYVNLGLVENLYSDLNKGIKVQAINLPGFAFHKALKARKRLKKLLQDIMDKKKSSAQKKEKKDMMDLLMETTDEEGRKLDDDDITDLLLVFLLAGHESSAHGVLWSLIYLTKNPDVFEKAKREQLEIVKRRPPSQKGLDLKEVKQMEYLQKVIDEMMRRTNITFASFRQAKVDVNMNGYTVPKGWKVLIWYRGLHMDPVNFVDPDQFDPSRWENYKGKAGSFLPFGLGSRLCPGNDLAKLEISVFLHHFLLNYRMERMNEDCPISYLPLPRPADNCVARIFRVD